MKPFLHSPRSGALHSARSAALHSAATPPFIRAAGAPFIRRVAALFILCAAAPRAAAQCAAQGVTLKPGWNAVYVEVSPEADATAVFGPWPVDSVGVYDPASFLATRQFSADGGSDGLVSSPIFMWNREYPEATSVTRVPAGVVCLCFNTNLASGAEGTFSTNLVGVPAAPRTTWHRSEGGEVLNYFGFSVRPGAAVAPGAYLAGFGDLAGGSLLRIGGKRREDPPSHLPVYSNDTVADGEVLLVGATAPSDWSGALYVSPMDGLDFGTNATLRTLSVRNDGGAPRTVSLKLDRAVAELDDRLPFGPALLVWRDADVARTNAAWHALEGFGAFASKRLAAGETWRLQFGLDRANVPAGLVQGIPFGALLTALDDDGGSQMKATVPLRAETSGADAARTAWPSGLWIADVALDTVDFASAENPAPAGGVLKLRLPLHVDAEGRVRLLQRVVAAGEADAAGNLAYRLYAGEAEPPATASQALRISSAVLPTETPVVEATFADFSSEIGIATFEFEVAADGATSLLRHPYHPQHDGLRWDFSTPAPSGDFIDNYKGELKPETFSVKNTVMLSFDFGEGASRWDPQDAVSGTCWWSFSGLRREGNLVASGPLSLKRVSALSEIVLE